MGWSHGTRWTEERIEAELTPVCESLGRMPSANELRRFGLNALACAVSRNGGYRSWSDRLGYDRKGAETHWAQEWERHEATFYRSLGAHVERMTTRHAFDLMVNGWRVDVKVSHYHDYRGRNASQQRGYTFAGLKQGVCCDFFHLVCCSEGDEPVARLVVPSSEAECSSMHVRPRDIEPGGRRHRYVGAVAPLLMVAA